jgi:hypothetical protein
MSPRTFLKRGPGTGCSVHASRQCCPSTAAGPESTLHLRRSKLARWPLPASAVQMTPFESTSMPRGEYDAMPDAGSNGGS